ncbi:MAG: hypothetical protein WAV45_06515 [Propionibacteriaceae bacterium]|nr:hypothetical protein [Micropruina sp.]HBX82073.1 hypothetical protein [Propionibacteriaceae bacterium]HBY22646.1 hypothetical protein [Propionibacteriaceae bacterium]
MNNLPTHWQATLGCLLTAVALSGCSSGAAPGAPSTSTAAATSSTSASASASQPAAGQLATRPNGKPACDWLTVDQVTAALGANTPAVQPGVVWDVDSGAIKIRGCTLSENPKDRVAVSVWTHPDAASAQAHLNRTDDSVKCDAVEGLGTRAVYCQFAIPEGLGGYSSKSVSVLISDTVIRQLSWGHPGDLTTTDLREPLIALYKQAKFPT